MWVSKFSQRLEPIDWHKLLTPWFNLVYNRKNRRILGAQFFSKHEVAQSANAISIAIQNRNTIDDLAFVDMLFNPNFDDPFNYLNLVAQQAVEKETKRGNNHPRLTAGVDPDPELTD